MKKVGIVTITSGANYGNRLQNYAMQVTLKEIGYNPLTIRKIDEKKTFKTFIKKVIKHTTKYRYTGFEKRIERFEKFNKKYINFSKNYIISDDYNEKLCNEFDYFICGSDQIWNPNYKMNTGCHFLSFVKGKNKISVSASFGVEEIDKSNSEQISIWLKELDDISVRERAAKKICENIVGREVKVLIDPTLMLTGKEWRQIARRPKNIEKNNYILCYLLGNVNNDLIENLKEYAIQTEKKIIFLEDIWRNLGVSSDEEFSYDPSEFVWLIDNADRVVTDSFHATVFSIIFNKKFMVIPREENNKNNMNSRFTSLIEMFDIKNAIYSEESGFTQWAKEDHKKIEMILNQEKRKFREYINKNLET
ncbi:polysaccharide pyruvyl transferase family protein [uncultured Eubacterium sp.]|uniref:polysaccharide pyruvyl transferase family protein n=1 Tax=Eubacterium sp. TaxID=142586 RepID=UPI0026198CF1|nr:polysaccharide pyruvyl transferase family protein [uncultured Eubacterium sp.]